MQTSCFSIAGRHAAAVSIARFGPRWFHFTGGRYPALAPMPSMLNLPAADFDIAYARQLEALNPQQVHSELIALAGPNPILLCHEKPEPAFDCHRLTVARWLEGALGISIPELDAPLINRTIVSASAPAEAERRRSLRRYSVPSPAAEA